MTPVPEWQTDASGNHYCDDDSQMQLAFACEFFSGFDLPAFDIWLRALPECGIKQEMLERRALAEAALRASNKDAAFRHLEWMLLRKSEWHREGFLLPLAKKEAKRAARVKEARHPGVDAWIDGQLAADPHKKVKALLRDAPQSIKEKIKDSGFVRRVTERRKKQKNTIQP